MTEELFQSRDRYFLSFTNVEGSKNEVTKEQFIQAERAAGFYPKGGTGCATGGFGNGSVEGNILTEWSFNGGCTWEPASPEAYKRLKELKGW